MTNPPTTGIPWLDNLLLWATVVIILGGGIAVFRRQIRPLFIKLGDFFDDWNGRAARPGRPREPGVVERLASVEYQVHNNGGESMKDIIDKTSAELTEHLEEFAAIKPLIEAAARPPRPESGE
jgi:hypothetical protein